MLDIGLYEQPLRHFIRTTAHAWREGGVVRDNSYGTIVQLRASIAYPHTYNSVLRVADTLLGAEHDGAWYLDNALGKALISAETGLDSHVAVRLHPGLVVNRGGLFPWGGAVIDSIYGIIVATSGFKEDEDQEFSRAVLERFKTLLNRQGVEQLAAAARRGSEGGAERFTCYPS